VLDYYHALALFAALFIAQCFSDWIDGQEPVHVPVKDNIWRSR